MSIKAPYDGNKATLPTDQPLNARNYMGEKECIRWEDLVIFNPETEEIDNPVSVRWWMGRSKNASVVYCSVWIRGNGIEISGRGSAGGYGYHKESAALQDALASAGVVLEKSIDGCGDGSIRYAMIAIADAMGLGQYTRRFV